MYGRPVSPFPHATRSAITGGVVQWRSVLARARRRPAGFVLPCQPVLSDRIPTGPEWIHELKWDGYRIIARREGGRVCLWSRTGRNWSDAFPSIVAAVERLPVERDDRRRGRLSAR